MRMLILMFGLFCCTLVVGQKQNAQLSESFCPNIVQNRPFGWFCTTLEQNQLRIFFFDKPLANAQWVWVGGTAGKATAWTEPRNWNLNRVPDEGSSVRIPQLNQPFYPEIKESVPSIAHLEVAGGAELHILADGLLEIDGQYTYDSGILLIGKIHNHGLITVFNTAQREIAGNEGNLITYTDGGQLSFFHLINQ